MIKRIQMTNAKLKKLRKQKRKELPTRGTAGNKVVPRLLYPFSGDRRDGRTVGRIARHSRTEIGCHSRLLLGIGRRRRCRGCYRRNGFRTGSQNLHGNPDPACCGGPARTCCGGWGGHRRRRRRRQLHRHRCAESCFRWHPSWLSSTSSSGCLLSWPPSSPPTSSPSGSMPSWRRCACWGEPGHAPTPPESPGSPSPCCNRAHRSAPGHPGQSLG